MEHLRTLLEEEIANARKAQNRKKFGDQNSRNHASRLIIRDDNFLVEGQGLKKQIREAKDIEYFSLDEFMKGQKSEASILFIV